MFKERESRQEIKEDNGFATYRNLLSQVSTQTGIEGYIKGGYTRNAIFNHIHGTNIAPKDIDVWLTQGVNLFVDSLIDSGARIQLRRARKKTPVFEMAMELEGRQIVADIGILVADADIYDSKTDSSLLIMQDIIHSDFTVNCLYLPLQSDLMLDNIIDPTGGLNDLRNKQVRMTSPFIFQDSPVCMLRAIKLADTLDAEIEDSTKQSIKHYAPILYKSYPSLIARNLNDILNSPNNIDNVRLMKELGIDKHVPTEYQTIINQLA